MMKTFAIIFILGLSLYSSQQLVGGYEKKTVTNQDVQEAKLRFQKILQSNADLNSEQTALLSSAESPECQLVSYHSQLVNGVNHKYVYKCQSSPKYRCMKVYETFQGDTELTSTGISDDSLEEVKSQC